LKISRIFSWIFSSVAEFEIKEFHTACKFWELLNRLSVVGAIWNFHLLLKTIKKHSLKPRRIVPCSLTVSACIMVSPFACLPIWIRLGMSARDLPEG
jgi:hypothetical protein